jgi:Domain of unknown function (DUF4440)
MPQNFVTNRWPNLDKQTLDAPMLEAWLRTHDSLWLGQRFSQLRNNFRDDVVFVPPDFGARTIGIESALEGYRSFVETSVIELYETHDYHFTRSDDTVIAEYAWVMKWASEGIAHTDRGREILALKVSNGRIKIFWRTQISTP